MKKNYLLCIIFAINLYAVTLNNILLMQDEGYDTNSERSYQEQGADSMLYADLEDLSDDSLIRYANDLAEIARHPQLVGFDHPDEPGFNEFLDRKDRIIGEIERRVASGSMVAPEIPFECRMEGCNHENETLNVRNENARINEENTAWPEEDTTHNWDENDSVSNNTPAENNASNDVSENREENFGKSKVEKIIEATETQNRPKKRKREDEEEEENFPEPKRKKLESSEDQQSPLDFVLEKQSTEMPDIFEADGE